MLLKDLLLPYVPVIYSSELVYTPQTCMPNAHSHEYSRGHSSYHGKISSISVTHIRAKRHHTIPKLPAECGQLKPDTSQA